MKKIYEKIKDFTELKSVREPNAHSRTKKYKILN